MSNPTKLLDEAFKDALARAAALDQQGVAPEDTDDLFAGRPPSNVELVQACLDFYRDNQAVLDGAVEGALNFLNSTHGVAQVKALEGSFASPEPNPLSVELASGILNSGEFEFALASSYAQPQALSGFGIGVSGALSAIVGLLGGAEVVFDFQDKSEVNTRTWGGLSFKGGLSISGGLELSFWVTKPITGAIAGWLIDLYIPLEYKVVLFIRFMYIKQRAVGATEFTFSGVSLQFPLGIGLPIRKSNEKHSEKTPAVAAVFAARQYAWAKSKRATLDVINKTTGVNTIAVEELTTLTVTLKNTSGNDVALSAGATMVINMPQYFSEDDVTGMGIDYEGWTFTNDGSQLTLTLSADLQWGADADLSFDITNVKSSSKPPAGQQSYPGKVALKLSDPSFSTSILKTAEFDLVWENSEATLEWKVTLSDNFTLVGEGSGSIVAYAQPGNDIIQLTTATDGSGNVWILGYVFNYNTAADPDKPIPQVYAAWWKQGSIQVVNKTVYYGNQVDGSCGSASIPCTTSCYYAGTPSSGSSITINVGFSSSV
ncbi:MAG TPA: hypothetical protein VF527_16040 [Pyrinomonadaceae bacterium]|jgi:hypothetical protein